MPYYMDAQTNFCKNFCVESSEQVSKACLTKSEVPAFKLFRANKRVVIFPTSQRLLRTLFPSLCCVNNRPL